LSRQYNVLLFVWLALSASYVRLMAGRAATPAARPVVHLARIAVMTAVGVLCTYVIVRLYGN
jgi:hypothetical protein